MNQESPMFDRRFVGSTARDIDKAASPLAALVQAPSHPAQGQSWTSDMDAILIDARFNQCLEWEDIQKRFFPNKTVTALIKRRFKLRERIETLERDKAPAISGQYRSAQEILQPHPAYPVGWQSVSDLHDKTFTNEQRERAKQKVLETIQDGKMNGDMKLRLVGLQEQAFVDKDYALLSELRVNVRKSTSAPRPTTPTQIAEEVVFRDRSAGQTRLLKDSMLDSPGSKSRNSTPLSMLTKASKEQKKHKRGSFGSRGKIIGGQPFPLTYNPPYPHITPGSPAYYGLNFSTWEKKKLLPAAPGMSKTFSRGKTYGAVDTGRMQSHGSFRQENEFASQTPSTAIEEQGVSQSFDESPAKSIVAHYTISRDLCGSQDSVASSILSVLAERSRE